MVIICLTTNICVVNSPIFAEIVPERARTNIYALDRSFDSILASFAPNVVGILAQNVYGYKPVPTGAVDSKAIETDRENAASLGKALYTAISIPMAICCAFYSFLYCTYPRDRDRARMEALIESEMMDIEAENAGLVEERPQLRVVENDSVEERSVIDVDYEGGSSIEFDENDEQRLLARELALSDSSTVAFKR